MKYSILALSFLPSLTRVIDGMCSHIKYICYGERGDMSSYIKYICYGEGGDNFFSFAYRQCKLENTFLNLHTFHEILLLCIIIYPVFPIFIHLVIHEIIMWRKLVSRVIIMITENSINWSGHEFRFQSCSNVADDMFVQSVAC